MFPILSAFFLLIFTLSSPFSTVLNSLQLLNGLFCFSRTTEITKLGGDVPILFSAVMTAGFGNDYYITKEGFCQNSFLSQNGCEKNLKDNTVFCSNQVSTGSKTKTSFEYKINCNDSHISSGVVLSLTPSSISISPFFTGTSATIVSFLKNERCSLNKVFYFWFSIFLSVIFALVFLFIVLMETNKSLSVSLCNNSKMNSIMEFFFLNNLIKYCNPFSNYPLIIPKGGKETFCFEYSDGCSEIIYRKKDFCHFGQNIFYFSGKDNSKRKFISRDNQGFFNEDLPAKTRKCLIIHNYLLIKSEGGLFNCEGHYPNLKELLETVNENTKIYKKKSESCLILGLEIEDKKLVFLANYFKHFFGFLKISCLENVIKGSTLKPKNDLIKNTEWKIFLSDVFIHFRFKINSKVRKFSPSRSFKTFNNETNEEVYCEKDFNLEFEDLNCKFEKKVFKKGEEEEKEKGKGKEKIGTIKNGPLKELEEEREDHFLILKNERKVFIRSLEESFSIFKKSCSGINKLEIEEGAYMRRFNLPLVMTKGFLGISEESFLNYKNSEFYISKEDLKLKDRIVTNFSIFKNNGIYGYLFELFVAETTLPIFLKKVKHDEKSMIFQRNSIDYFKNFFEENYIKIEEKKMKNSTSNSDDFIRIETEIRKNEFYLEKEKRKNRAMAYSEKISSLKKEKEDLMVKMNCQSQMIGNRLKEIDTSFLLGLEENDDFKRLLNIICTNFIMNGLKTDLDCEQSAFINSKPVNKNADLMEGINPNKAFKIVESFLEKQNNPLKIFLKNKPFFSRFVKLNAKSLKGKRPGGRSLFFKTTQDGKEIKMNDWSKKTIMGKVFYRGFRKVIKDSSFGNYKKVEKKVCNECQNCKANYKKFCLKEIISLNIKAMRIQASLPIILKQDGNLPQSERIDNDLKKDLENLSLIMNEGTGRNSVISDKVKKEESMEIKTKIREKVLRKIREIYLKE